MTIQLNIAKNIESSEKTNAYFTSLITEELHRFKDQVTRVEVHLTDENGKKEGKNDKRCVLEIRLEGLKPMAVTHHADTEAQAVQGALDKLKTTLNTTLGRLSNHRP